MGLRSKPSTARASEPGRPPAPPGVRWIPWLLIAIGVVLIAGSVVARLELSMTTSKLAETTDTRPLEPLPGDLVDPSVTPEPASRATKFSVTTGPPSDTLLGIAITLGVTLLLAGAFYYRVAEVPLPGGLGSVKLVEPGTQAFPPSRPVAAVPAKVGGPATPSPLPDAIVDQSALARLGLRSAQAELMATHEVRVAVLTVGLDPKVASHPAFETRIDTPYNTAEAGPGDLMAAQVSLIAAMAPQARILPVGVFGPYGQGSAHSILEGSYAARDWEPDIVYLDFGVAPGWPSAQGEDAAADFQAFEEVLDELERGGVLIVAPAGNDATDEPQLPAARPYVLGVAALEEGSKLAVFSSRGVELAAPGVQILAAEGVRDDELVLSMRSGTSLAAGVTTGVAALVSSARPSLDKRELRQLLVSTGADVDGQKTMRSLDVEALVNAL